MTPPAESGVSELLEAFADLGLRLTLVSTGGGCEAIAQLVGTPGASRSVLEGLVPYATGSIDRLLGGPQERYCCQRTARRLAAVAWQRAAAITDKPANAIGAAVTASLATTRPKRGGHRLHVAVQSLTSTATASVELEKGRTRGEEEQLAAAAFLRVLAEAVGQDHPAASLPQFPLSLATSEQLVSRRVEAADPWRRVFSGQLSAVRVIDPAASDRQPPPGPPDEPREGMLLFPGSFDPLHEGHRLMARIAEEVAERPAEFELSITNVDKPPLDYLEIDERLSAFHTGQGVWLSRAATFLEKAEIFPKATFVMGADTYARLADPAYYHGSADAAKRAVKRFAERVAGLIIFGREHDGEFVDPSSLPMPKAVRGKAYFVSAREFRMDISSSDIRRREVACESSSA